ncbi:MULTISPECIES: tyrosinase family oxidase copper chaperone [unclassified Streptomyces]|uniref:tyrosinase family oxidase copper chaperone n=1 Tax=unclassified Streptomyces TaxID=2593676 RepID=UPI000DC75318|nr:MULTISPECIES: tyrosinase family oxidase copper chaperone [unclassified Streptomyces]AWZ06700.1 tyrosinase co-factor protein [Streptomyces sp. ICC4]AWZ15235.1 tyrosinase co-factor protein [Streptomyces sp. ICC1]
MYAVPAAAPLTRRAALRTAFTAALFAGTAAALAPVLRARRPRQTLTPAPLAEETYRGRHIAVDLAGVRIDGRALHVMRRADGSYLSGINHFQSYATPLELARAAVDELGTNQLAFAASHHGGQE